jgi:multisubunit Na+/H+ antiporter MnhG subunit
MRGSVPLLGHGTAHYNALALPRVYDHFATRSAQAALYRLLTLPVGGHIVSVGALLTTVPPALVA